MSTEHRDLDSVICDRGTLRRADGGYFELFRAEGQLQTACEPGDTMYIRPYLYTCTGHGRWVRGHVGLE